MADHVGPSPYRFTDRGATIYVYRCDWCAALVDDPDLHRLWHERLEPGQVPTP